MQEPQTRHLQVRFAAFSPTYPGHSMMNSTSRQSKPSSEWSTGGPKRRDRGEKSAEREEKEKGAQKTKRRTEKEK